MLETSRKPQDHPDLEDEPIVEDGEPRRSRHYLRWLLVVVVVLVAFVSLYETMPPPPSGDAPAPAPQDAPAPAPQDEPETRAPSPRVIPLWEGTFDERDWQEAFGIVGFNSAHNADVVDPPFPSNGKVLRVKTPGSRDQKSRRGMEFRTSFEEMGIENQEAAYFRYRVWFPEDYEWVEGGKLPGLAGVVEDGSPWLSASSDEGDHDENQWSGRIMWKAEGRVISYLNVVRAAGRSHDEQRTDDGRIYSISLPWRKGGERRGEMLAFRPGWNTVELFYRMNTPGEADGLHRGWLNGELGIDLDDVEYRAEDEPELDINQINFAVFYGGPLGPRRDARSYFDDVAIAQERLGEPSS